MNVPPRAPLALTPTPILKLDRLSRELGVELFIKRDDLTGLLESGNKVRKLEFLVGEALAENADTLITCGTLQSNCCRAVAAVAARLGLRAVLAVKGERPAAYEGNLLLGRLLGAEIRYLSDEEFACADETLDRVAAEVRARGGRPYVIPESGSNEVGALGYLECAVELAEQINHGAPRFDAVAISVYSGGSQAGLLMGKQLAGLPAEIVGIPIARPADTVREHVGDTIGQAMRRFGFAIDVPKSIHLLDGYQGVGRASVGEAELAGIVALARSEGVVLDPVYTAKAFGGLVDTLRRDPKALGQRVCFIHTGGIFSLFAYAPQLSTLLDR
ncbi:MAG TPA: pyridoxal-phosphate dependent enzyme [Candidatus Limnocylindrales bacterium]|nr:pyridoxal-phosphate dependent enzyme [Candidatus Limnocylindrales bacterium]